MVAILSPSVYTVKSVYIYKSFDFEGLAFENGTPEFSLMPVTDVYSSVQNGEEAYFLDGMNRTVRILGVEKETDKEGKVNVSLKLPAGLMPASSLDCVIQAVVKEQRENLREAQNISAELASRLQRLKSELVTH